MNQPSMLFLICSLLFSCVADRDKKIELDKVRFNTTDASELFFKNLRKSDYISEELPSSSMEVYRMQPKATDHKLLTPALIINWKNDNAFIMLEKADSLPENLKLIISSNSQTTDTLYFDGSQQMQHAQVAVQVYNAILDKNPVFLLNQGEMLPLFSDDEREKYRRIVMDFLRLVELR